jgi:Leu/Phe-tRNA-protein transferase
MSNELIYRSTSLHSIEIWDEDNLIAGEFGFAIGGCYQSASGFSNKAYNGAGTIQCVTLGSNPLSIVY